jgi:hypothetical protein
MNKKAKRVQKKHKRAVERVKRKTKEAMASSKSPRRAPVRKKKADEPTETVAAS